MLLPPLPPLRLLLLLAGTSRAAGNRRVVPRRTASCSGVYPLGRFFLPLVTFF